MDNLARKDDPNFTPVAGEEHRKLVFVIEDDQDLQTILTYNLQKEGYAVRCFSHAENVLEVLDAAPNVMPVCLVVDINLAGHMNGLEATRFLRARRTTAHLPILVLTAKGDTADIVKGLEEGADDYLPKPFEMDVFLARLRALDRRGERNRGPIKMTKTKIAISEIDIDPVSHKVQVQGKDIELTMTEFGLLSTLMSKPNEVFERDDLLLRVMGPNKVVTARTIDVHVRALRAKLGRKAKHIHTVRGLGYKFIP